MNRHLAYAGLIGATLMTSGAFAQSNGGADQANMPQAKSSQTQPNAPTSKPADFVANQAVGQWRATKLAGVSVYDADNKKIGAIKEVLIDHDGAAKAVIIGVGGFLGVGTKDIAVPFAALQWKTESRTVPAADAPASPIASTTGATTDGRPPMKTVDPAAIEANQGYPDKAVLSMSLAELKSAPDFHYAPDPRIEASQGAEMRTQSHSNP
jgi:hypothetical protein